MILLIEVYGHDNVVIETNVFYHRSKVQCENMADLWCIRMEKALEGEIYRIERIRCDGRGNKYKI